MAAKDKLLWISEFPVPPNVRQAVDGKWDMVSVRPDEPLCGQLNSARIAIAYPNGQASIPAEFAAFLDELNSAEAMTLMLLSGDNTTAREAVLDRCGKIVCARHDASCEELSVKLSTVCDLQPAISNLQKELTIAQETAAGAARAVEEVDEEMRLAGKLQRDFLPSRMPEVGQVRFAALFQPVSWVSGDIYDIFRLDETHVGFHVIDAVGHGMPAALLTMFIKKALQTKRIAGNSYQIVPPHVTLSELNADICEQNLSSCQFCTAIYCVIDTSSLKMTYCRAGHPEPILIRADGQIERLSGPGSLLGVFPESDFQSRQVQLEQGDRVVLFSDGAEDTLCGTDANRPEISDILAQWAGHGREELLLQLMAALSHESNTPIDDVTVTVMDVVA